MVKISNYALRKNKEGKHFLALELQGEVELIQSTQTGRFYATAKRCSISSTFTEEEAKTLIGTSSFSGGVELDVGLLTAHLNNNAIIIGGK